MWHIAKRELYDNLNSLRFALATVLILALMLTNAIVYLREHPARAQAYHNAAANATKTLEARSTSLYRLAAEGPGDLHKAPSPLRFCAEGDEAFLPTHAGGSNFFPGIANVRPIWRMIYPQETPHLFNIRPDFTTLDWAFIVGYVLSFIALLFTFDSISGELERGTLRLTLANAIPRHIVLVGKFLGAFISINIPVCGCSVDEPNPHLYFRRGTTQCRGVGTFRHLVRYRCSLCLSLYRVGTSDLGSGARERCEPCRAVVNLGQFCDIYTEYVGIYWQSNVGTDSIYGILDPAHAACR